MEMGEIKNKVSVLKNSFNWFMRRLDTAKEIIQ